MEEINVNVNYSRKESKLRLYNALVEPILLYNCGTWGLNKMWLENNGPEWPNRKAEWRVGLEMVEGQIPA